jgi:hypothetical protein
MLLSNADHRLHSLRDSYLVRQLRFRLQSGSCAHGVTSTDNMISPADSPNDGPFLRAALGCSAQRLFLSGDYQTLNSRIQEYSHSMKDLPDGTARLAGMTDGLGDLFEFGGLSVTDALNRVSDWRRSDRTSPYPDLIETMVFHTWAYGARGHAFANAVSPIAMELFEYRLNMAADSLDDSPAASRATPLFYELAVSLARDRELGLGKVRAAFDQGIARFPADWSLYSKMLAALMPRWGGSFGMVDGFIVQHATGKAGPDDAMYARLYSIYGSLEGDQTNIFSDANASWPRMKHGFEVLRTRYATSDYLLNRFARFACVAGDRFAYRTLRPQTVNRISASAWSQATSLASCDKRLMQ